MVCSAMAAIAIIGVWSLNIYDGGVGNQVIGPDGRVQALALVLFAVLGLPLAVSIVICSFPSFFYIYTKKFPQLSNSPINYLVQFTV